MAAAVAAWLRHSQSWGILDSNSLPTYSKCIRVGTSYQWRAKEFGNGEEDENPAHAINYVGTVVDP